jgi:hypothetical protein
LTSIRQLCGPVEPEAIAAIRTWPATLSRGSAPTTLAVRGAIASKKKRLKQPECIMTTSRLM